MVATICCDMRPRSPDLLSFLPLYSGMTSHYISKPKHTGYMESWEMANILADQEPGRKMVKRSRRSGVEACGST